MRGSPLAGEQVCFRGVRMCDQRCERKFKKTKFSSITRGHAGSPRWTGCSGSLPSPFRVLAPCVSGCSVCVSGPSRAGKQAESE